MGSRPDEPELVYPAPLATERGAPIASNGDVGVDLETPILIVGGGPVGMLQALMLARLHDQACTLIEREATTTTFPKMEYTNGRSMEIYRQMGLHEELRALATVEVPEKYASDEVIVTSLAPGGKLVHVWERDGAAAQRQKAQAINDGSQYLEPHMRCHQILIEKWLKQKVDAEEKIQGHWATSFVGLHEHGDHVVSQVKRADGTLLRIRSQYVIGCDGGGSWVRKSVGLESKRNYMDLTMAFVHFRSAALRATMPFPRFWHGNVIGGGVLVSQNENDVWTAHYMLPPGVDAASLSADDVLAGAIGGCQGPVAVAYDEIYCRGVWKVDVAIADKFRSEPKENPRGGRVFLAGDAAHQLSPVGGHGLNSGLGDAFDLAWKLAATVQGWAGDQLLTTYDTERRQIAFENLGHVQDGLASVMPFLNAQLTYGADVLNGDGEAGEQARRELDELCKAGHWLHNQNGNILGYAYKDSPVLVVAQETKARPQGTDALYVPTTWPGSQAPHVWMKDGTSTIDRLRSAGFSLADFSEHGILSQPFVRAAHELGVPLHVLSWQAEENVRKVYERDLVLIRPDMHVAWRCADGAAKPLSAEEAGDILSIVSGRGAHTKG